MPTRLIRAAIALATTFLSFATPVEPARAQTYESYGSQGVFQPHVMSGYSATSGVAADYLQGGWVIDGGFTYWPPGSWLGIRADLSYSGHNATTHFLEFGQQATGQEVDDGSGEFAALSAGLVYRAKFIGASHIYGLAQAGVTHVRLQLTQTFFVPGYYCDPFFGYCDYAYAVGASTVYDYSTTRLSWNAGVGVEFPLRWGRTWFIEGQYRRIETQQPLEYWPITVGIRF